MPDPPTDTRTLHDPADLSLETTAFLREVVLPAGADRIPRLDRRVCRFQLEHRASPIHRWGIFASELIPARRRVVEYTGQRINPEEVRRRSVRPRLYIFWVSPRVAIDGAIGGSGAEFINHGCTPNLVARIRDGRVHLVSLRAIAAGEELLFDYRIRGDVPLSPCSCGSPQCRGFLNRPDYPSQEAG
jgi:SET domain-containing protein